MSLAFEMKTFCVWKVVISKSHDSQILQNANFKNGDTTIQIDILCVLNIFTV